MKLAILEDDLRCLAQLRELLTQALLDVRITDVQMDCFSTSSRFLSAWVPHRYDLVLLDIYIDEKTGIQVARELRQSDPDTPLVFCTTSNDFASESYEVDASYYLIKPVTLPALHAMLRRLELHPTDSPRVLLPDGAQLVLEKVLYTQYFNHVVTFHLLDAPAYSLYITQAEVARMLSDPCFYPANQGSIVNLNLVKKLTRDGFLMADGVLVPISRRRYREAKDAYTRFHFQTMYREAQR